MGKTFHVSKEIIKDPKNYAAIYARVSSYRDNNSINAQISEAKKALSDKNLMVYGVYEDHVSGRYVPPYKRKGFSKLLTDAEAGCFKTIIAYKHDRIARNLEDWIELREQLKKLGINVIFSDDKEYVSDNSMQGEFLENLMVMVAELEPNNIQERASAGAQFRRNQGIFKSGNKKTFGYLNISKNEEPNPKGAAIPNEDMDANTKLNAKSVYKSIPLEAAAIRFIYKRYAELMDEDSVRIGQIKESLMEYLDAVISNINSLPELTQRYKNDVYMKFFIEALNKIPRQVIEDHEKLSTELQNLKKYLSETEKIRDMLTRPVYGGFILRDAQTENKGIVDEDGYARLDIAKHYVPVKNADKIITDFSLFQQVFCHYYLTNIKIKEQEYLFKGKLICGFCGRKLKMQDNILICPNPARKKSCKSYSKTNLTETILEIIIDDILKSSVQSGFEKFLNEFVRQIAYEESKINSFRTEKLSSLIKYLDSSAVNKFNNESKAIMEEIFTNEKSTNNLLRKMAYLRKQQEEILSIKELVKSYYDDSNSSINKAEEPFLTLKSRVIAYIISNLEVYSPMLNNIIESIRVITIEEETKCSFTIKFNYEYRERSKIHQSIN